jgi:hypothetical protein
MSNAPASPLCETPNTALFLTSRLGSSARTRFNIARPRAPRALPSQNVTFLRCGSGCAGATRRSSDASAAGSPCRAIAEIAASVRRSSRFSAGAVSDSSSAMLSAARTPSSQITGLPPASSSQSSENTRTRSISRAATRNMTTMRSEPCRRTAFAVGVADARRAIDVPSAAGSMRQTPQQFRPGDVTTLPFTQTVSLLKQHMIRSPSTAGAP